MLWQVLTAPQKEERIAAAVEREQIVRAVQAAVAGGLPERQAIKAHGEGTDRTTYRRWNRGYEEHGLDGLIDLRYPPRVPVSESVVSAICALRTWAAA